MYVVPTLNLPRSVSIINVLLDRNVENLRRKIFSPWYYGKFNLETADTTYKREVTESLMNNNKYDYRGDYTS